MIRNIVEAFLLGGQRKVGIGFCQDALRHVRVGHLSVGEVLLLIRELHHWRLLILQFIHLIILVVLLLVLLNLYLLLLRRHGDILFVIALLLPLAILALAILLGGILCSLLGLLLGLLGRLLLLPLQSFSCPLLLPLLLLDIALPLGGHPLYPLLSLLGLKGDIGGCLFLFEHDALDPLLEVLCGVANHDHSYFLEVRQIEAFQKGLTILLDQVGLDLHHDQVSFQCWCDRLEHVAGAEVVERRDAKTHIRLVIRSLPLVASGPNQPALLSPIQDHAVAQFSIFRVFL
mmetsp:Transcript_111328/g.280015  ORF Transcript_111328/g.280015 Transcript_111328/m.280015 type:complete len:288 (+) Transcript_111328:1044-1907(+)